MTAELVGDAIQPLSEHVAGLSFDRLTDEAIGRCKVLLTDALGVAVAGSSAEGIDAIVMSIREWRGAPQATLLVFGDRVPAPWAALANGTMMHAREFEDVHMDAFLRPSGSVIPAALAVAETSAAADGRRLITAIVAGYDIMCRIGRAIPTPVAFARSGTLGVFGAAGAAASLLGLDASATRDAFGIALAQASATLQAQLDGATAKKLTSGLAAKAGVMSALWAHHGLTGAVRVLEGPYGYLPLYERGNYERDLILAGLGDSFAISDVSMKPYPCAIYTQAPVTAALELRRRHAIRIEEIDRITVSLAAFARAAGSAPIDPPGRAPQVEAMFSVPYVVASALVRGHMNLGDLTVDAVNDPSVLDVARRITIVLDEDLPAKALAPVTVTINLRSGESLIRTEETVLGSPANPLDEDRLRAKLEHCLGWSARPLPSSTADQLTAHIVALETLPDVTSLVSLLVPPA